MNKRPRTGSLLLPPPPAKSRKTRQVFVVESAERKASPVEYGACAFTKNGVSAVTDQNNVTWIKSSTRQISIPIFHPQTPLGMAEQRSPKHLNGRISSGQPVVFGKNNEIVLTDTLSSGQDGIALQGYFAGIKHKVVLKIPNRSVAHYSEVVGCAPVSSEEEQSDFEEMLREFDFMSTIKCGRGEGPIVCALGAAAISLGGKIYIVIALELMDTTSEKYVNLIYKSDGDMSATKQAVLVVLKAYANIKVLHSYGVMHMDAHHENWLVKYKGLPPMKVDVRMVDLGRSCSFNKPGALDDCTLLAAKPTYKLYDGYKFYGLIEFIQFIGFVLKIFGIVMKQFSPEVRKMIYFMRDLREKYSDYFYEFRMSRIPQEISSLPFETFIDQCQLPVLLSALARSPSLFTPNEIAYLTTEGLIPE